MKRMLLSLFFIAVLGTYCFGQRIQPFTKNDRISFLGNSITDGGHYHSYIWLYYMTRFPDKRIEIFNSGIGGDVIKMMYNRLDADVLRHDPNKIILTFGMNDTDYGIYLQPDARELSQNRIDTAFKNYSSMEQRLKSLTRIEKILMTSSPYDETAKLKSTSYTGKNAAMLKINEFMKASADRNNWGFLDLNGPMTKINQQWQKKDSTFSLDGKDRIHPEQDGHLVMAYLFLRAQGLAGREVAKMTIDGATGKVQASKYCKISGLSVSPSSLQFNYLAESLPFPVDTIVANGGFGDTKSQGDALKVIPFTKEFNQELLAVKGLKPGNYVVEIDEEKTGQWSSDELSKGINLAELNTPQHRQAKAIMYLNEQRWEIERRLRVYYWFQFDIFREKGLLFADNQAALDALKTAAGENIFVKGLTPGYLRSMLPEVRETWEKEMKLLIDQIYTINKPKSHRISIKPVQ